MLWIPIRIRNIRYPVVFWPSGSVIICTDPDLDLDPDPDPSIIKQKIKKVRKILISSFYWFVTSL
jgi:hypothetical protein